MYGCSSRFWFGAFDVFMCMCGYSLWNTPFKAAYAMCLNACMVAPKGLYAHVGAPMCFIFMCGYSL
jgi:hypothetical protein